MWHRRYIPACWWGIPKKYRYWYFVARMCYFSAFFLLDVLSTRRHPAHPINARVAILNPFRTPVPFWEQTTQIWSSSSPKRDCDSKRVKSYYTILNIRQLIEDCCVDASSKLLVSCGHKTSSQRLYSYVLVTGTGTHRYFAWRREDNTGFNVKIAHKQVVILIGDLFPP